MKKKSEKKLFKINRKHEVKNKNAFVNKQDKENIRKKAREDIEKKSKAHADLKSLKPKKEFHREFKRLMKCYCELSQMISSDNINDVLSYRNQLINHMKKKLDKSYIYAFIYIRQLALTIRKVKASTSYVPIYSVYNWQFISSLELWTEYVVQFSSANELVKTLVQPLVQLIVGVIRIQPTTRWLPLRFHCLKLLNRFTQHLKILTPVLANLIEIFDAVDFNQKKQTSSKSTMNLMTMLHFSTSQLTTFEHLEISLDQIFQIIVENIAAVSSNLAFPEYVVHLSTSMKRFVKVCKVPMFNGAIKSLVKKINGHSQFVLQRRRFNSEVDVNEEFEKFVQNYRSRRLAELQRIMEATKHIKFTLPQDDYQDSGKRLDLEENESENNEDVVDESDADSVLDEAEFDEDEDGYDSAVDKYEDSE